MQRMLLFLVLCVGPATAATFEDYERAREALERGEVLPLADILSRVEAEFDARMIEVEFEADDDPPGYIYEFELITRDGRILEVTVAAATGRTVTVEDEEEDDED